MSELIQSEAVVLKSLPFKEYDRILTLFSPQGLFKLFAKGKKRHYVHFAALTSPFTLAEFHYHLGRKELHRFLEGSIINQNLHLRQRYETLQAAEKMTLALLKSQWIGKAAPHLFQLFCLFIANLPKAQNAHSLITTFFLKIMRHEGILQLVSQKCEKWGLGSSQSVCRYAGERYHPSEAPLGSLHFLQEEENLLTQLAQCRSFSQLSTLQLDTSFQAKIETLFQQAFN